MLDDIERKFAQRVHIYFKRHGLLVHEKRDEDKEFIHNLYSTFTKQGRVNAKTGNFALTPTFMVQATAEYFKITSQEVREIITPQRTKRPTGFYQRRENFENLIPDGFKKGLIARLGRPHQPSFKMTTVNGAPLTPSTRSKYESRTNKFNVSFSPLEPTQNKSTVRARAMAAGESFESDMGNHDVVLWRKMTPSKSDDPSPNRIRMGASPQNPLQKLGQKLSFYEDRTDKKVEKFEFSVTAEDITARENTKRGRSQKAIMGGATAKDTLEARGAKIPEKQHGRHFHWSHLHGWSLNGAQIKENLHPATAGSNYDTLFKVEAPIKGLLREGITQIDVTGTVDFQENGLPHKITYELNWGIVGYMKIIIDPLSSRVPTVSEHEIAMELFKATAAGGNPTSTESEAMDVDASSPVVKVTPAEEEPPAEDEEDERLFRP